MTDRERWTVYPLLFLTLGISVKDKIVKTVNAEKVQCNMLVVSDRGGRDRIVLTSTPTGGILRMQGDKDLRSVLLGSSDNLGLVFVDARGNALSPILVQPQQKPAAGAQSAPKPDAPAQRQPAPQERNQPEPGARP